MISVFCSVKDKRGEDETQIKEEIHLFRLRKYLRPYIFLIILSIILLFGQGMADLFLPDLMSDIVNVGIQRGGIEHSAPEVLSEEAFRLISDFSSEENLKILNESYSFTDSSSSRYKSIKDKYPEAGTVYVLKDNADISLADNAVSRAELALMLTMQSFSGKNNASKTDGSSFSTNEIDIKKLYPMLDSPQIKAVSGEYIRQSLEYDESFSDQVGAGMAKLFYKELGADMSAIQSGYILRIGIYMILITLCGAAATILVSLTASKVSAGAARSIRSDIFRKVESFSNSEFDKFSTASLITRTTNDITQIQNFIFMGLRMICYAPIMGIGGAILASYTTTTMSWIIIAAIAVLLFIMLIVFFVAMPKFKIMQSLIDRLNLVTRESLSGLLVIRAFSTERFEEKRFDKANRDLSDINLFVNRVMTFLMPVMMLIMNGVSILIVWIGSHQIEQSQLQVGDMMAFIQYSMMIILSFLMIAVMFIIIPRSSVSAGRIADVLESDVLIRDPENPVDLPGEINGEISFENVSFRYENAEDYVLKNISFKARPGETTAFIGTTGSGKTTLINLICRFYDVTEGSIKLDGIDVRSLRQHDLREQIGLVPQKGILFSGDIASNLRYGREDAADQEIEQAAQIAQATGFISEKSEKYSAMISQGGSNVSGGQKQRLAIARALVRKAKIYIFDDSFSALDFKTDAALRKALKKYTQDSTVLIVGQRISTIMHSEKIIVLDEGKIVGMGGHNELLKNCPQYREIAVSQNIMQEI